VATKDKAVGFFQITVLSQAQRHPVAIDWNAELRRVAALPMTERQHDSTVYEPNVEDGKLPLLGVHALLKTAFMSNIDSETATISDLMEDAASQNKRLANSTAIAFLPIGGVVAVATGSNSSPKPPAAVKTFLDAHIPLRAGDHWDVQPLMDTAKIQQFRDQASGAQAFETRLTTVRDVFSPESSDGIVRFADDLADRVGGDLIVEISVRLAPEASNRTVRQQFRDLVLGDLPRVASNPKSRTKVTAILEGGVQEELNLVAARLAATIQVDDSVTETMRFSALMDHLRDVSGEMEDRVKLLIEG